MPCNGCGNKSTRHDPPVLEKDIDEQKSRSISELTQGSFTVKQVNQESPPKKEAFVEDESPPPTSEPLGPYEAFQGAKKLSFEEIMYRAGVQQKAVESEIDKAFSEMTQPMRQYHIMTLLSVANYENMNSHGVTPEQAIVGLKEALEREDFNFINNLYPHLKPQVLKRYQELVEKRILL